jgi:eukaryotic-like serine/threonine-protein kinase
MGDVKRTLAGRYQLVEVIGRGAMGTVYRATDLTLGRSVAVKLMPGSVGDQDPTSVARFEREARAAAALNHPAVVAVYDAGADETTRFIVMELVSGRSLEAILRDEGPLEPDRAAGIAARVADALAAAHAAGIVHRDIKPANVMVAQDGSVKVLDFGIARAIDGTALTQSSSVLGTAAYMSPEQAFGKPADARSDIYSLGCVLYALLGGHPPFAGDSVAAILNQHASVAPRSLDLDNSRVTPELNALVLQMLAKSPDDRPSNAAEVRDRLTLPSASPPAAPAAAAATARLRQTAATRPLPRAAGLPPTAARPDRRGLFLAGALAALVLVIAVVALASGGSSPHATTNARRQGTASKATTPKAASSATTTTTTTKPATSTSTTAPTTTAQPRTVAGAAGALTALVTQDVQSGTIDQQAAQQITTACRTSSTPTRRATRRMSSTSSPTSHNTSRCSNSMGTSQLRLRPASTGRSRTSAPRSRALRRPRRRRPAADRPRIQASPPATAANPQAKRSTVARRATNSRTARPTPARNRGSSELMSSTYNMNDAKTRLSELAERAASGEEIVITQNGYPLARLAPLEQPEQPRRLALLRDDAWVGEDFDYPLPSEAQLYVVGEED